MKAHISIEEFHSFIEMNKERTDFNERRYDWLHELLCISNHRIINERDFTIHKMFEILESNSQYINPMFYPKDYKGWIVDIVFTDGRRTQKRFNELCDGLWDAIINYIYKE